MTTTLRIHDHRLESARQVPSPNRSPRPASETISLLVIHNISLPPGQFGGGYVDDLFCNCLNPQIDPFFNEIADLRVSAHLLIDRCGRVTQYVSFNEKAWHAGQSSFEGRENCNDFSIGIELEGTDNEDFTEAQYLMLSQVSLALLKEYPAISPERIVGHCDIAPLRKTDPGPCFNWNRYRATLAASLEGQQA